MKKVFIILLILITGVGLWFYLLMNGRTFTDESSTNQEQQTTTVKEKPKESATQKNVSATTSAQVHTGTDAGMEFPTL